jgi:hypothetical protein
MEEGMGEYVILWSHRTEWRDLGKKKIGGINIGKLRRLDRSLCQKE